MHWCHCLSPNGPEYGGKEICSNDSFLIRRANSTICDSELKVQTQDTNCQSSFYVGSAAGWSWLLCFCLPTPSLFLLIQKALIQWKTHPSIMHKIDSSYITKEANLCLGSGPHMKMKARMKVNIRPKQVNPISHHEFSGFREFFFPIGFT